jgi:hypothetical protein
VAEGAANLLLNKEKSMTLCTGAMFMVPRGSYYRYLYLSLQTRYLSRPVPAYFAILIFLLTVTDKCLPLFRPFLFLLTGNTYSIENPGLRTCKLVFTQARKVVLGEVGDEMLISVRPGQAGGGSQAPSRAPSRTPGPSSETLQVHAAQGQGGQGGRR